MHQVLFIFTGLPHRTTSQVFHHIVCLRVKLCVVYHVIFWLPRIFRLPLTCLLCRVGMTTTPRSHWSCTTTPGRTQFSWPGSIENFRTPCLWAWRDRWAHFWNCVNVEWSVFYFLSQREVAWHNQEIVSGCYNNNFVRPQVTEKWEWPECTVAPPPPLSPWSWTTNHWCERSMIVVTACACTTQSVLGYLCPAWMLRTCRWSW